MVGGMNTACTAVGFYLLSFVLPVPVAFSITYVAGLAFVVYATPRLVFRTSLARSRRLVLAGYYLALYGVGIGMTTLLDAGLGLSRLEIVAGTLAVMAPLGFFGSRTLISDPAQKSDSR